MGPPPKDSPVGTGVSGGARACPTSRGMPVLPGRAWPPLHPVTVGSRLRPRRGWGGGFSVPEPQSPSRPTAAGPRGLPGAPGAKAEPVPPPSPPVPPEPTCGAPAHDHGGGRGPHARALAAGRGAVDKHVLLERRRRRRLASLHGRDGTRLSLLRPAFPPAPR